MTHNLSYYQTNPTNNKKLPELVIENTKIDNSKMINRFIYYLFRIDLGSL